MILLFSLGKKTKIKRKQGFGMEKETIYTRNDKRQLSSVDTPNLWGPMIGSLKVQQLACRAIIGKKSGFTFYQMIRGVEYGMKTSPFR